jgi:hypothetical protein
MSNKPDKSSFLRAESELVLDLVSRKCTRTCGSTIKCQYLKARQEKEKKIAGLGSPIRLKGQALDMLVRGNSLWIAENTGSVLVIDLFVCCAGTISRVVEIDSYESRQTRQSQHTDVTRRPLPPLPSWTKFRGRGMGIS